MNKALFVVTRQSYWSDGRQVVEVAQGGHDYSNADALCKKYDGEFEEFIGMKPAVEKAIEIANKWKKDCPDKTIEVTTGCTHGMSMEFEGVDITYEEGIQTLLKEAEKFDDKLPHCTMCGELLGKNKHCIEDDEFCSESCAERFNDVYNTPRYTKHYQCSECSHKWTVKATKSSYDPNEEDMCLDCGEINDPIDSELVFLDEIE
jgi:hypothetical protein